MVEKLFFWIIDDFNVQKYLAQSKSLNSAVSELKFDCWIIVQYQTLRFKVLERNSLKIRFENFVLKSCFPQSIRLSVGLPIMYFRFTIHFTVDESKCAK